MERKKFTFRYDESIEALLDDANKRYRKSSTNALLECIIYDAVVSFPDKEKQMQNRINSLEKEIKALENTERAFKELVSLLNKRKEINQSIDEYTEKF